VGRRVGRQRPHHRSERLWRLQPALARRAERHIFGTITTAPYAGQKPLKAGDNVPANNPLYALLKRSLDPSPPASLVVNGQTWPVMPFPFNNSIANYTYWLACNDPANPPRLIDALSDWIALNHKPDDTPHSLQGGAHLDFAFVGTAPPAFPVKPKENAQILFVASFPQDDGQRPGSVPAHYWDSSLVYVTDPLGNDLGLPVFKAGGQHTIAAVIGNSSPNLNAGSLFGGPPLTVICNAYAFSTFLSPGTPLPALCHLDATNPDPTYQQPFLQPLSRAVAGFRFDVDTVFKGLTDAMNAKNYTPQQLGGLNVDGWLKASGAHACVKVLIEGGEMANAYNMNGRPTDNALPSQDRHIAQRNLAGFDMGVIAMKKIMWQPFMMSQAGAGANALAIKHGWPVDAVRFYVAVPTQMWERYCAKANHRGFEVVHDAGPKPLPDSVILRETAAGGRLEILDHAREPQFGMALGVEVLKQPRPADISL
jgi:hypothetical protein